MIFDDFVVFEEKAEKINFYCIIYVLLDEKKQKLLNTSFNGFFCLIKFDFFGYKTIFSYMN